MADNRFSFWKEDDLLKRAMQTYVQQGLKREEAIDFYKKTFLNTRRVSELLTDVCAISEFITMITLFRLKMLKRLSRKNWRVQVNLWVIEPCTRKSDRNMTFWLHEIKCTMCTWVLAYS